MLKMFDVSEDGGSPGLWEKRWSDSSPEAALRFCEIDPLRPLFEKYAPPGTTMLEGGCGLGQYVRYYSARGVRVVGCDFAPDTLRRLHQRNGSLKLAAGDVAALPFQANSFDVYYSGGVVEHFEGGPERALDEARRVLRPGGVLLISVPYFSPLRHLLFPLKRRIWKLVPHSTTDSPNGARGRFWQYAYRRSEFGAIVRSAGFRLVSSQGYAIIWGLYELPFFFRASRFILSSSRPVAAVAADPRPSSDDTRTHPTLLKRLLVGEDADVPVAGLLVRTLRWACANMMMYVCISTKKGDEAP